MKPIPIEAIEKIPTFVEPSKESCAQAADTALLVLFLMGIELEQTLNWPPVINNGHEVWPLPAPWESDEEKLARLIVNLNGHAADPGYLAHVKRNAQEYNLALETNDIPLAEKIAAMGPQDSALIWSDTNALAHAVETESVYRTIELSIETKGAYQLLTKIL